MSSATFRTYHYRRRRRRRRCPPPPPCSPPSRKPNMLRSNQQSSAPILASVARSLRASVEGAVACLEPASEYFSQLYPCHFDGRTDHRYDRCHQSQDGDGQSRRHGQTVFCRVSCIRGGRDGHERESKTRSLSNRYPRRCSTSSIKILGSGSHPIIRSSSIMSSGVPSSKYSKLSHSDNS